MRARERAEFKIFFFLSSFVWKTNRRRKKNKTNSCVVIYSVRDISVSFLFTFLPPPLLYPLVIGQKWDRNINTTCCSLPVVKSPKNILTRRPKWWIDLTKKYLIFTNGGIMAVCVLILKLLFLFVLFVFFSIFRRALAANHLMGYMRIYIHLLLPSYSPPDKFLPFRKSKFSDEIRLAAADLPLHVPRWHLNNWAYRIIIKTPPFF